MIGIILGLVFAVILGSFIGVLLMMLCVVHKEDEKSYKSERSIKIKKLKENAIIPQRGSEYSAGADLAACIDSPVTIQPHTTVKIGTGLAVEIPEGYFGGIFARSGLSTKEGLRPANCVGVCDSDYRGEYIVPVHNDGDSEKVISPGDRIAQLIIIPYAAVQFMETDRLSDTDRDDGGFGSTGK